MDHKMRSNISSIEQYLSKICRTIISVLNDNVGIELMELEKKVCNQVNDFDYITFGYDNFYHFLMEHLESYVTIEVKFFSKNENRYYVYLKSNKIGCRPHQNSMELGEKKISQILNSIIRRSNSKDQEVKFFNKFLLDHKSKMTQKNISYSGTEEQFPNMRLEMPFNNSSLKDIIHNMSHMKLSQIENLHDENLSCKEIKETLNILEDIQDKNFSKSSLNCESKREFP